MERGNEHCKQLNEYKIDCGTAQVNVFRHIIRCFIFCNNVVVGVCVSILIVDFFFFIHMCEQMLND